MAQVHKSPKCPLACSLLVISFIFASTRKCSLKSRGWLAALRSSTNTFFASRSDTTLSTTAAVDTTVDDEEDAQPLPLLLLPPMATTSTSSITAPSPPKPPPPFLCAAAAEEVEPPLSSSSLSSTTTVTDMTPFPAFFFFDALGALLPEADAAEAADLSFCTWRRRMSSYSVCCFGMGLRLTTVVVLGASWVRTWDLSLRSTKGASMVRICRTAAR
mmetsp:Transcript_21266/g.43540  ORF Transcript_21266/g.43540 Transcript_21266/m.43540 type:complete len:216 (+) Transcript_21266:722-1369(+)